jgi:MFS family permease
LFHERPKQAGAAARVSLLAVTVLGTMSSNIVNVPLRSIAADFDRPVGTAVLCVIAFSLVLAVAMPLTGWLGDRFGRKRVLCAALTLMGAGQLAAACAPSLPFLIVTRGIQGLGCSAVPPVVMGVLVWLYPAQRSRMMGAWAAANGIGQAVGPPVGGIVADLFGWRSIFVLMAAASLVVLSVIVREVPASPPKEASLHLPGALLLTGGVGLVLAGISGASQPAVPYWADACAVGCGAALVIGFGLVSRDNPRAMIPVRYIVESRFARSAVAAFAQMFTLGTALVGIPLLFTGPIGLSPSLAGLLFFALPVTMAVMAPAVGRLAERFMPRPVLRLGLLLLAVGTVLVAWAAASSPSLVVMTALLVTLGVGMAMVQTPAATGATRSPAGKYGAALGLFNLLRFSGSTAGAAWVALLVPGNHVVIMYLGCTAVAAMALALSFAGPNPVPVPDTPPAPAA